MPAVQSIVTSMKRYAAYIGLSVMSCLVLLALCACSTGANKDKPSPVDTTAPPVQKPVFPAVTFTHEMSPVGDMMRAFGEQAGGGFVLMSGLEERAVPKVEFQKQPYEQAIAHFASAVDCIYMHTPYYYLVVPPEYQQLETVSLAAKLNTTYASMNVSAAFGAKTELFIVLAALSESLDITVVADNFIAESCCGEVHLPEAPLAVILEAILQSARIPSDTLVVESTPEYIFLRAAHNESQASLRLDTGSLTAEQSALLDKEVSLSLPGVPGDQEGLIFAFRPIALREALYPVSEQLGVKVVARRGLVDIPVNPVVIKRVRLETAMNLLIRQWPLAGFCWELQADRILLREQ